MQIRCSFISFSVGISPIPEDEGSGGLGNDRSLHPSDQILKHFKLRNFPSAGEGKVQSEITPLCFGIELKYQSLQFREATKVVGAVIQLEMLQGVGNKALEEQASSCNSKIIHSCTAPPRRSP